MMILSITGKVDVIKIKMVTILVTWHLKFWMKGKDTKFWTCSFKKKLVI